MKKFLPFAMAALLLVSCQKPAPVNPDDIVLGDYVHHVDQGVEVTGVTPAYEHDQLNTVDTPTTEPVTAPIENPEEPVEPEESEEPPVAVVSSILGEPYSFDEGKLLIKYKSDQPATFVNPLYDWASYSSAQDVEAALQGVPDIEVSAVSDTMATVVFNKGTADEIRLLYNIPKQGTWHIYAECSGILKSDTNTMSSFLSMLASITGVQAPQSIVAACAEEAQEDWSVVYEWEANQCDISVLAKTSSSLVLNISRQGDMI